LAETNKMQPPLGAFPSARHIDEPARCWKSAGLASHTQGLVKRAGQGERYQDGDC